MGVLNNLWGLPGMGTEQLSVENAFLWGPDTWYLTKSIQVVSSATDAGSTPTTDLRPGLVMGKITASGKYTAYSSTATDGSQVAEGVLFNGLRMLSPTTGSVEDKLSVLVVAGPVKGGNLFGLDQQARNHMQGRFVFDDDLVGNKVGWKDVVAKTANYTVVTADNNVHFTTTGAAGAVTFTLPAVGAGIKGLRFRFTNTVGQNMSVVAPAGKLVTFNNAAATSVTFSTAANLIGATVEVVPDEAGAKWIAIPSGANTMTVA